MDFYFMFAACTFGWCLAKTEKMEPVKAAIYCWIFGLAWPLFCGVALWLEYSGRNKAQVGGDG